MKKLTLTIAAFLICGFLTAQVNPKTQKDSLERSKKSDTTTVQKSNKTSVKKSMKNGRKTKTSHTTTKTDSIQNMDK
jgi:hypothetical protein